MATVNSVDVNGTSYDIEDTEARNGVSALKTENKTTKDNISDTDQIMIRDTTEKKDKLIDYDKLADAILTKITSKQFTLDQGSKTLVQALNELNSKVFIKVQNLSTFSINIKLNKDTFTSFLMYGATSPNNGFMYIVFINVASENRAVNFIKIADFAADRTFSGTYNDDTSTLTINANNTVWGGIKLLMLK